ncbi:MAG: hypothetical protein J5I47_08250 [Vicingus serpentipes]|nr:hypothetical protein [Vicingus serpentipes]
MEQIKFAQHFTKLELMKVNIEVFQNESGKEGVDFVIRTATGSYHELYLKSLNLEKESSVEILKEELAMPKDNLWIALVLIMKNMDSSLYLIPSTMLLKTKAHTFLDQNNLKQPYWKINVFLEAIPELSKFSLANVISQL